jgi:hypothetical protein
MKKPMMPSGPSSSAAGMRKYKPRRPEMTLDDVVTPETRAKRAAMMQGAKDEAMTEAAGAAYNRAMPSPERYAKGGSASSRADGCAERGKTKGTMIMCGGGMARGK